MALPTTGSISLDQVRTELNRSDRISLGDTDVRSLASKTSGMMSLSDLRGKSTGSPPIFLSHSGSTKQVAYAFWEHTIRFNMGGGVATSFTVPSGIGVVKISNFVYEARARTQGTSRLGSFTATASNAYGSATRRV